MIDNGAGDGEDLDNVDDDGGGVDGGFDGG